MKKGRTKKSIIIIIVLLFLIVGAGVLLALSKNKASHPISTEDSCSSDADCVPSSCCHPTSCTTKAQAPECKGALCSQVCAPGSLDCGQGSCSCINNKCKAVLKE